MGDELYKQTFSRTTSLELRIARRCELAVVLSAVRDMGPVAYRSCSVVRAFSIPTVIV